MNPDDVMEYWKFRDITLSAAKAVYLAGGEVLPDADRKMVLVGIPHGAYHYDDGESGLLVFYDYRINLTGPGYDICKIH